MRARFAALLCAVVTLGGEAIAQCPANSQPPVAQSPSGTNLNANSPITFSWTPSTSAAVTGYVVNIGNGSVGTTVACSASGASANSCTVSSLPVGQYVWAVKATTNVANCELGSAGKTFTVGCLTSSPAIQSPSDNSTNVSQTPTMTWSAVSGADSYDAYFGEVGSGACLGQPVFTTSSTSFNPPGTLKANTSYEWRVVAKKTGTNCPFTTTSCEVVLNEGAPTGTSAGGSGGGGACAYAVRNEARTASVMGRMLEPEPDGSGDLPHVGRTTDQAEIVGPDRSTPVCDGHAVENVLRLKLQISGAALAQAEDPPHLAIERKKRGTRDRIATRGAPLAGNRQTKCGRIEVHAGRLDRQTGRVGAYGVADAGARDLRITAADGGR